jgi:hypothetical protein
MTITVFAGGAKRATALWSSASELLTLADVERSAQKLLDLRENVVHEVDAMEHGGKEPRPSGDARLTPRGEALP